jgi:hypothetical protein
MAYFINSLNGFLSGICGPFDFLIIGMILGFFIALWKAK